MQQRTKKGRFASADDADRQGIRLDAIPNLVVNDNSSAAIRCGVALRRAPAVEARERMTPADPATQSRRTNTLTLWLAAALAIVAVAWLISLCPTTPNAVAGLSLRELVSVMMIVFVSGVMSGLSGFGFSAVGAASLLFLAPVLQVPLFQALSTGNQLFSIRELRDEMPKSMKELWAGPGPCMLGGAVGVPIGIWLLFHLPAARLMAVFGVLLTAYAVYSLYKPASFKLRGCDGRCWGAGIGLLGGVVGGFTAFPGAAVVVWTGLRGLPKAQHRAIVQPYIIVSQIYSLALVAAFHPSYLTNSFWLLLALSLPVVVPGTLTGLAIYRRMSDVNFKRISYVLLGISGMTLLAKTCGPWIQALFRLAD
jgi:hypothetical protein